MKGQLRKISIVGPGPRLDWRYGQEPIISAVELIDGEYSVSPAQDHDLLALAGRLATAAAAVLRASPLDQTDLELNVGLDKLGGGCWWTVLGGPYRSEFKAETLAKIKAQL